MNDYNDREILSKFLNKKITVIGRYIYCKYNDSGANRDLYRRILFRDVQIKGTQYKLDHLWIPDEGIIEDFETTTATNLEEQTYYEIKGEIKHYFRYDHSNREVIDILGISCHKSYKIDSIYHISKSDYKNENYKRIKV